MAKDKKKINTKNLEKISYADIIKDGNPKLREISYDLMFPLLKGDKKIMSQMIDYVRRSQLSVNPEVEGLRAAHGISAIQLGHAKKLIYLRIENAYGKEAEEFALINPKIIDTSKDMIYLSAGEGCLSIEEEHEGYVYRPSKVVIEAIDFFTDREIEIEAKGLTSIVLQHEMDHLLGILYYDRINKLDPYFKIKNAVAINR